MTSLLSRFFSIPPWITVWLSLLFISLTQAHLQIVTVTASPSTPSPPSYTSIEDFKDTVMSVSNTYRKEHGAGHLIWNKTLADYALNWANGCIWEHSVSFETGLFLPAFIIISSELTRNRKYPERLLRRKPRIRLPQRQLSHLRLGRRETRIQL